MHGPLKVKITKLIVAFRNFSKAPKIEHNKAIYAVAVSGGHGAGTDTEQCNKSGK